MQEEPENMGAWDFIRPHLIEVSSGRTVRRVARPRSASPAEGSAARHALNQQAIVNQAYGASPAKSDPSAAEKARARQPVDDRQELTADAIKHRRTGSR